MDEAALWEWLAMAEQSNPGAFQKMIAAGLFDDTSSLNAADMKMGADMSAPSAPQGQNVGGTYIAANPMEHLAYAIQRGQGLRQINEAKQRQGEAIKAKGVGQEAMIRAMAKPPPPISGGPVQAPVDYAAESDAIPYYLRRPGY